MSKAGTSTAPGHVLIIGAGEFGLATALSLLSNPKYKQTRITIVDTSPELPNPSGSSVDANRIVRADYASAPYSKLALEVQAQWRDTSKDGWGGEGRYHEPGFVLTADEGQGDYVKKSLQNVRAFAAANGTGWGDVNKIQELNSREEIQKATGYEGVSGDHGYANFNSGWADAEACVAYALRRVRQEGHDRVTIRNGTQVDRLLFSDETVMGAQLKDGEQLKADLIILAAGAWSPSLIDLQGRCLATGQAVAFIDITQEEQDAMAHRPTVMNMSRGMFIIPPRDKKLKIARHGYGYRNLVKIPRKKLQASFSNAPARLEDDEVIEVSVPEVGVPIPLEAEDAIREAMAVLIPHKKARPFTRTRICWYCDTPSGDFLMAYHPQYKNLFLATGGSGHGFKFFPVIGDKIVDALEGNLDPELAEIWRWKTEEELKAETAGQEFLGCDDGSRAGRKGMILAEEAKRTR
ncbi:uncharacterized protein A1O9_01973 [Exophiala aquamarina CBS 119918]|uniref:FAD dependent oxidoreductase domain-containing protein n=1 Tax=Exophiala aquamarina CBS 119918 TaxID=1182545 RepID=A0A072PKZ4_9EURO|nr:uncharacterized protein A1O9_01973 [Exophiala aquamarina CBS 119918]KEF60412.1 hypothetical protein A1O9_01973 [Exophiala aquamarina CBS 119918]